MRITNSNYITELQKEFRNYSFVRLAKSNGLYITNDINKSLENDSKIFKETQVKRLLRGCFYPSVPRTLKKKLAYFSQNEEDSQIYKFDKFKDLEHAEEYVIQNIGHATQLIQISGFNILTDPIFNGLNWALYPALTDSYPIIEDFPIIDVVIISHNHRDHTDSDSLRNLMENHKKNDWPQPQIFVPQGDKTFFENLGFNNVEEVEWYTQISVSKTDSNGKQGNVNFISIPADHRSGRYGFDHHNSLVTGWIINPEPENVIFKFSGDTRSLTSENQQGVDAALWNEIKNKTINRGKRNDDVEMPDIICFEPSGPNYTRPYMDLTHQSTSYSVLLKFVEAENLAKLSGQNSQSILKKLKTIMMHHKKFELGPDRFNEGLFVFKKLFQYLHLNERDLNDELVKQNVKRIRNLDKEKLKKELSFSGRLIIAGLPEHTSLLVHAKDFIIQDIMNVTDKVTLDKETILHYLINGTIFPKIGERLNNMQVGNSRIEVENIRKYNRNRE